MKRVIHYRRLVVARLVSFCEDIPTLIHTLYGLRLHRHGDTPSSPQCYQSPRRFVHPLGSLSLSHPAQRIIGSAGITRPPNTGSISTLLALAPGVIGLGSIMVGPIRVTPCLSSLHPAIAPASLQHRSEPRESAMEGNDRRAQNFDQAFVLNTPGGRILSWVACD